MCGEGGSDMAVVRRGNSWSVIVSYRDQTGRSQQIWRSAPTKAAAKRLEAELLTQRDRGANLKPEKLTVAHYLARWLEDYAELNLAPSTSKRYRQLMNHVIGARGNILLQKLQPADVQSIYGAVRANGLSAKTTLNIHRVLKEALSHAERQGLIDRNPCNRVQAPRAPRFEPKIPDVDDLKRILEVADAEPTMGALVKLAIYTGMRQGELLGVRWHDVDFERRRLAVRRSKTASGHRAVILPAIAIETLKQHRKAQAELHLKLGPGYSDQGIVFATSLGTAIDPGNFRRGWDRIRKAAGIEGVRFHDLRHAQATLLLSENVHPKVVAERLGHSRVDLTLNVYSHVLPGLQERAADVIDRLFAGEAE